MLFVVLAVMCICVILVFAARPGKTKLKIAKPSHQRGKQFKRHKSCGE
jgi:hypothetical protein